MFSALALVVLTFATRQVVKIALESDMPLIARARVRVQLSDAWYSQLAQCAWCLSVWVAAALSAIWIASYHALDTAAKFGYCLMARLTQDGDFSLFSLTLAAFGLYLLVAAAIPSAIAQLIVGSLAVSRICNDLTSCLTWFEHDQKEVDDEEAETPADPSGP